MTIAGLDRVGNEALKQAVIDFSRGASIEMLPQDEPLLGALLDRLPAGTTIYVAHPPQASLQDVVRVAGSVESAGFRACPHIVARRLENERVLRDALQELRESGVEQLLLVAGDIARPRGAFSSTTDVLSTGATVRAGFKRLGVCGHPEGHRAIGPTALWTALRNKQAFADQSGTRVHIVSQFGFNPEAVCNWAHWLLERGVSLPVHVGIAGPTSLPRLIKFAMQCGVAASLHALMTKVSPVTGLIRPVVSPDEMLSRIVYSKVWRSASSLVQPHFFGFGGVVAVARWLRAVVDGAFEISGDEGKFVMRS